MFINSGCLIPSMVQNTTKHLIMALVVVLGFLAALFIGFYTPAPAVSEQNTLVVSGNQLVSSYSEVTLPVTNTFVTKRSTDSIDPSTNVAVEDTNGKIYVVKAGTVLVGNMVVSASSDNYAVQRLDKPAFSIN